MIKILKVVRGCWNPALVVIKSVGDFSVDRMLVCPKNIAAILGTRETCFIKAEVALPPPVSIAPVCEVSPYIVRASGRLKNGWYEATSTPIFAASEKEAEGLFRLTVNQEVGRDWRKISYTTECMSNV
jgi:hypothetical protein